MWQAIISCSQFHHTCFDKEVYTRMVKCCVQLKQYTQAAVLSQLFEEPDYMATFKYLQEKESHDGMDIYYDYLWDINIMEYLIHLHDKRGELDKKQQLITIISNPEINTNNPEPILQTCRSQKTAKFFDYCANNMVTRLNHSAFLFDL
ncbi:INTS8 [Bugula neritina]|uniref:INTS8 n=1 Tax=Bugula neritina TaxID=10212 RepID=A0A7J7KLJ5_BUGNE|nr:INTS8 [Bugula neritina]